MPSTCGMKKIDEMKAGKRRRKTMRSIPVYKKKYSSIKSKTFKKYRNSSRKTFMKGGMKFPRDLGLEILKKKGYLDLENFIFSNSKVQGMDKIIDIDFNGRIFSFKTTNNGGRTGRIFFKSKEDPDSEYVEVYYSSQ